MNILLIGYPGRFRDGLQAVLDADSQIQTIYCADNISEGLIILGVMERPLLIFIDGNRMDIETLTALKGRSYLEPFWIFIADTWQQQEAAYAAGANTVLLRGFSKATLSTTLNAFVQPIPA